MKALAAVIAVLALAAPARAHRLDEYLQATRVAVSHNRVELRIDLTPGASIAALLTGMDPDGSGGVSRRERKRYAQQVLRDLHLELDGKRVLIKPGRLSFPPRAQMVAGEGIIHLTAVARISRLKPGPHRLLFRNDHLPRMSVYLVNALVPESKHIVLRRQLRDELQREYRLEFEVAPRVAMGFNALQTQRGDRLSGLLCE
jgi:hypothetical protein